MNGFGRWRRAVLALVLAPIAALLVSGCTGLRFVDAGQQDTIGKVRVVVALCASKGTPDCPNGNSGLPALSGTGQILLGFEIPAAAIPPASFLSSPPGPGLVFGDSPGYAAELQRLDPAGAGLKWVGYLSDTASYFETSGPQSLVAEPEFGLGQGADGSPFATPFTYRVVAGGRAVQATTPGSRPVSCGASLTAFNDAGICVDSSLPLAVTGTRDLGIVAGARDAERGTLATVPFVVGFAGSATPAADFALSASTTLPGVSPIPILTRMIPASNSVTRVPVALRVPKGATTGAYQVTLTARLANGQTRSATGVLRVSGISVQNVPPSRKLRIVAILPQGLTASLVRSQGLPVIIGSNRRGVARIQLLQGKGRKPRASLRVRVKVPGPTRVVLRSATAVPGPYRVRITIRGKRFVLRGILLP